MNPTIKFRFNHMPLMLYLWHTSSMTYIKQKKKKKKLILDTTVHSYWIGAIPWVLASFDGSRVSEGFRFVIGEPHYGITHHKTLVTRAFPIKKNSMLNIILIYFMKAFMIDNRSLMFASLGLEASCLKCML